MKGTILKYITKPLCTEEDSAKYSSMIGCCEWIIVLGRFYTACATSAMSEYTMLLREGHLKVVKSILAYLKTFPYERVIVVTKYSQSLCIQH